MILLLVELQVYELFAVAGEPKIHSVRHDGGKLAHSGLRGIHVMRWRIESPAQPG
jgi:hypothetical protein